MKKSAVEMLATQVARLGETIKDHSITVGTSLPSEDRLHFLRDALGEGWTEFLGSKDGGHLRHPIGSRIADLLKERLEGFPDSADMDEYFRYVLEKLGKNR